MSETWQVSVPSPCRDICQLDSAGICLGCGRTLGEIGEWTRADNARRLQIRATARERVERILEVAQSGEFAEREPR